MGLRRTTKEWPIGWVQGPPLAGPWQADCRPAGQRPPHGSTLPGPRRTCGTAGCARQAGSRQQTAPPHWMTARAQLERMQRMRGGRSSAPVGVLNGCRLGKTGMRSGCAPATQALSARKDCKLGGTPGPWLLQMQKQRKSTGDSHQGTPHGRCLCRHCGHAVALLVALKERGTGPVLFERSARTFLCRRRTRHSKGVASVLSGTTLR